MNDSILAITTIQLFKRLGVDSVAVNNREYSFHNRLWRKIAPHIRMDKNERDFKTEVRHAQRNASRDFCVG